MKPSMSLQETDIARKFAEGDIEARLTLLKSLSGKHDEENVHLIIEAMGDSEWRVRKEAVAALSTMDDPVGLVHRLIERISDNSNVGRRNAAFELFTIWGKICVPPLLEDLMKVNEDTQKVIIDVLGDIRDPAAIPFLLTHILGEGALEEASAGFADNLRSAALEALGKLRPSDEAVSKILPFLSQTGNYLLVFSAIKALERIGSSLAVPHLIALAQEKPFARAALEALGTIADIRALDSLLSGFHAGSENIRSIAVKAIVHLESRQADKNQERVRQAIRAIYNESDATFLLSLLNHTDPILQSGAIRILGWVAETRSVQTLILLLNDYEEDVIESLIAMGSAILPELSHLIGRGTWEHERTRHAVARVLGEMSHVEGIPLLRDLLNDNAVSVREAAVRALGRANPQEAVLPLLSMLKDPYPEVQEAARHSLLALKTDLPMESLVHLLSEKSTRLRANVAILLGEVGYTAAIPALAFLLKDSDEMVRRAAVLALGFFLPLEDVRATLLQSLGDEDYKVRVLVLQALARQGGDMLLSDLAPMVCDENIWVRTELARTLMSVPGKESLRLLLQLAGDPTGMVQIAAITSLGQRRESEVSCVIQKYLHSPDRDVQKAAILALGVLGDSAVLPELIPFLSDAHWELRAAAASAVGNLKGAVSKLTEMSRFDSDPLVREAASLALSPMP